jgi:glycine cleavage system H protein
MKYTETHEWLDEQGKVGITPHAQKELGDIVYVELPKIGSVVKTGDQVAVLESTKAAVDVYTPVSGKIVEINEKLKEDSGLINTSPEREGWIFKIQLENASEADRLMDEEKYLQMIK